MAGSGIRPAVPANVRPGARKLPDRWGVGAAAGDVELDECGFIKRFYRAEEGVASFFALETGEKQNAQGRGRGNFGRLDRPDVDGVADDFGARRNPAVAAVQFQSRARWSGQHLDGVLKGAMVESIDAAQAAEARADGAVAALHGGARAEQVAVVQGVDHGCVAAGNLPDSRGEAVDVMGVDGIGADAAQHGFERGDGGGVPEIHRVPERAGEAVGPRGFAVVAPVKVERGEAPDANALPFIGSVVGAVKIACRAGGDHIHALAEALERQGQLRGGALGASHGVGREQ